MSSAIKRIISYTNGFLIRKFNFVALFHGELKRYEKWKTISVNGDVKQYR